MTTDLVSDVADLSLITPAEARTLRKDVDSGCRRCDANEESRKCCLPCTDDSRWCPRHTALQGKLGRAYHIYNEKLDAFEGPAYSYANIRSCDSVSTLLDWSRSTRKQWLLTKRTIDTRRLHHLTYYGEIDAGHQAWIDHLTDWQVDLEDRLLSIDERAYELLVSSESAQWLQDVEEPIECCDDDEGSFDDTTSHDKASATDPSLSHNRLKAAKPRRNLERFSAYSLAELEAAAAELDAESAYDVSVTGCRERFLNLYTKTRELLADDTQCKEQRFALDVLDGLLRYVISRVPRILVRAKSSSCAGVYAFLVDAENVLVDEDYHVLCRAATFDNVHRGGCITTRIARNVICEAENPAPQAAERAGDEHIDLLGGRVWRKPLKKGLTPQGWDMVYRLVPCRGCCSPLTQSMSDWARLLCLSRLDRRYPAWAFTPKPGPDEMFRPYGGIVSMLDPNGKIGKIETIPGRKNKGPSVSIERDKRGYLFLRFASQNPLPRLLKEVGVEQGHIWVWPGEHTIQPCPGDHEDVWQERIRSAFSVAARKVAKWSIESKFEDCPTTHRWLLRDSYEKQRGKTKVYREGAMDVFICDLSSDKQDFERLCKRIIAGLDKAVERAGPKFRKNLDPDEEDIDLHDEYFKFLRTGFTQRCYDCENNSHTRHRRYPKDCWDGGGLKNLDAILYPDEWKEKIKSKVISNAKALE